MQHSGHYRRDHLIAKVVVFILHQLVGVASIELDAPYVALVLGTAIWLFGVNTAAFVVESLAGHDHRHDVI